MRTNDFGATGLRVSEIGFGGSRIGGIFASGGNGNEALNVLGKALHSGITFYDTADMYAQGESESLIGKAFRGHRQEVILATKGGFCLPARRTLINRIKPLVRPVVRALGLKRARLPAGISGSLSQDFSPAHLTHALEQSLKRLQTDCVDLYQLHSPDAAFMRTDAFLEALHTLETLRKQGKLRFYGIATEIPEDAASCLAAPGISSVQLGFGVLDPQALDDGTLSAARANGLAVIARGCFGGGLLKDGLDETQLRTMTPKWQQILELRAFAQRTGRSPLDVALQFCRGAPAVSTTLLGMRTADHLSANQDLWERRGLDAADEAALMQILAKRQPVALAPRG